MGSFEIKRREFLVAGGMAAFGLKGITSASASGSSDPSSQPFLDARSYLKQILYTKEEVQDWLAGKAFPFARYHSDFGWLLNSGRFRDGVDGSMSVYTYVGEDGERLMTNYGRKPCRINTYGNSFTQCHQVSDHETWQEVLAAHLQEPVRNFGIGGWSVFQAYLRMLKEEARTPAENIIFNIFDDDHRRNLDSWRNIRRHKHSEFIEPTLPYVKVNVREGNFLECKNPCPTPESVYDLCDLNKAYELFKDDFVLQVVLAHKNAKTGNPYRAYEDITKLATTHGIETQIETNETLARTAEELHVRSSLFASRKIVEKVMDFARNNGKNLMFVLSYPAGSVARFIERGKRWDQPFVDFLKKKEFPVVDLIEEHAKDFSLFQVPVREYLKRYFIGHYNPRGNLFCAFAIKDKLVRMLDPKPISYT